MGAQLKLRRCLVQLLSRSLPGDECVGVIWLNAIGTRIVHFEIVKVELQSRPPFLEVGRQDTKI